MKQQPVALVYNPAAGDGRWRSSIDSVRRALEGAGGEVEMFPTRAAGDGIEQGRLAAQNHAVVAVHGGDGTVNEALNGVIASGKKPRVLVLPGGTMNVLCRDLGIPSDAVQAASLLRTGVPKRIFLGLLKSARGQRYFAIMAGAGLDAAIVHGMKEFTSAKRLLGPFAFLLSSTKQGILYGFPEISVTIEDGDAPGTYRGYEVVVGNSKGYGGWFTVTDRADPTQPGFEVAIATSGRALRHLTGMTLAMLNSIKLHHSYKFVMATRLRIASTGMVPVQIDGDAESQLPIELSSDGTYVEMLVPSL